MSESEEALQRLLPIVFEMLENGKLQLGNVPHTIQALKRVQRLPDGTFDLSTVEPPVRALCWGIAEMADQPPPADYVSLSELPKIDLPNLEKQRASEEDFLADLIEASNSVRKYLILVAGLWPVRPLDRQSRAVLMGHMVRLFKLYDTLAILTVERRTEAAWIICRALVDTIINLTYLLKDPARSKRYVRQSLAYEKKLMEEIQRRLQDPPLPIETRMLRSIQATFDRAGVNPAEIKAQEWRGLSSERKARAVGLEILYEFGFRVASHNTHGTWHDLEFYQLELVDGDYRPEIRFHNPRPQILELATVGSLDAVEEYLRFIAEEKDIAPVLESVRTLRDWFLQMSRRHEEIVAVNHQGQG